MQSHDLNWEATPIECRKCGKSVSDLFCDHMAGRDVSVCRAGEVDYAISEAGAIAA